MPQLPAPGARSNKRARLVDVRPRLGMRSHRLAFWLWIVAGFLAVVVADGLIGRYV
jgi:hypothetical protein